MIKILERSGLQGTHLYIIKAIYSKLKGNINLNGEKLTMILLTEIRNKTRLSTLSISI